MDQDKIRKILEYAGYHDVSVEAGVIKLEDPSCVLREFDAFLHYAWIGVCIITGMLLAGWAVSKIYGAKDDIFTNMKNLILIFGVLTVIKPVMNIIYGADLFAVWCKPLEVPIADISDIIEDRNKSLSLQKSNIYEDIYIYDSGPVRTTINPEVSAD